MKISCCRAQSSFLLSWICRLVFLLHSSSLVLLACTTTFLKALWPAVKWEWCEGHIISSGRALTEVGSGNMHTEWLFNGKWCVCACVKYHTGGRGGGVPFPRVRKEWRLCLWYIFFFLLSTVVVDLCSSFLCRLILLLCVVLMQFFWLRDDLCGRNDLRGRVLPAPQHEARDTKGKELADFCSIMGREEGMWQLKSCCCWIKPWPYSSCGN